MFISGNDESNLSPCHPTIKLFQNHFLRYEEITYEINQRISGLLLRQEDKCDKCDNFLH